jgi:hypothetical protein
MTPKQKKAFEDLEAVVKTLIGKVFELEDENREMKDKLGRVMAHPALAVPPLSEIKA